MKNMKPFLFFIIILLHYSPSESNIKEIKKPANSGICWTSSFPPNENSVKYFTVYILPNYKAFKFHSVSKNKY